MKSGKACLALAVGLCGALLAKVEPSALFSDHAVLHRSAETPVFGFADVRRSPFRWGQPRRAAWRMRRGGGWCVLICGMRELNRRS